MPDMTTDFYASRPLPLDQADGLRRLFTPPRAAVLAVAANPHVAFSGVLLERVAAACAADGRRVLVVDAADSAPAPHELALLDVACGIEALSDQMSYLAARGLALRHVDTRGSCAGFLQAVRDAAPQADVLLVHASASELSRIFVRSAIRPLLLAADQPTSVTHAYAAMKLLSVRNGLMAFDLLLAASPEAAAAGRRRRIAEQLATCADNFLGAVLHDWTAVDPACDVGDAPTPALLRLVRAQLDAEPDAGLAAPWAARRSADTTAPLHAASRLAN